MLFRPLPRSCLVLAVLGACTNPSSLKKSLDDTQRTLAEAHRVHARVCAPEELANAESALEFTRVEFFQGHVRRASEHLDYSERMALAALNKATPCGTADRDEDTIADIVDQCPDEKEDFDGVLDEDGCRDIDPNGDEDGDGIKNSDDACIDDPEDFDGHDDEDGCPETSADSDGDGLIDALDQCPNDPEDLDGYKDSDGCPDPDNDDDTVADLVDNCPKIPEDLDGWEDQDGCPDPDNDLDGIPDTYDKCPDEPGTRDREGCPEPPVHDRDGDGIADEVDKCPDRAETFNKYLDEDGCPDKPPGSVRVTKTRIEIDDTIQFETGSATLKPVSHTLLDQIVKVLKDAPDLRISVEGHTDSEGADSFNLKLSQDRAASVMAYLVAQGVDRGRLQSMGHGETKPIDTNRTSSGRARNRRVEFIVLDQK